MNNPENKIEKENETNIIACMRVKGLPKPDPLQQQCEKENCENCGAVIWTSLKKRAVRAAAQIPTVTVCMWCAIAITHQAEQDGDLVNEVDLAAEKH